MTMDKEFGEFFANAKSWQERKEKKHPPGWEKLNDISVEELILKQYPPRTTILTPWLPEKGLAMIFSERGVGKTWLGLNIAHTIAGGCEFLRWKAPIPRKVLYIDGEMAGPIIQERINQIGAEISFSIEPGYLRLLIADDQENGLPDLADPEAQHFYNRFIEGRDLIIIDNLSTICRGMKENEADTWGPVQEWCLRQRAAGRTVLLLHHAGKSGAQRGTSRKEDALDTVISLRRPANYDPVQGARFEIHFKKCRGFWGYGAEAFEARLMNGVWQVLEIEDNRSDEKLWEMKDKGMSLSQMSGYSGYARSTISEKLRKGRK